MNNSRVPLLQQYLTQYRDRIPLAADTLSDLCALLESNAPPSPAKLLALYDRAYPLLEKDLWEGDDFEGALDSYQALFREQEDLIVKSGKDERYDFLISITIADRPEHLKNCLESIYQLCLLFGYGGKTSGVFDKVRVIVAEDSKLAENIQADIELAKHYSCTGLTVIHFDQTEQFKMQQAIPEALRQQLGSLLCKQPEQQFYLKGQATNRNLSYLKMLELTRNPERTLYYLVDSDQQFKVNRATSGGEQQVAAVNYFYYINRIFCETDTRMLTGKLVGDPPVSPSVMAANFIQDVTGFFQRMAQNPAKQACQFHQQPLQRGDGAAYHDMAKLFGFENSEQRYPYQCQLSGDHDNQLCLDAFCDRLNAFFYGEHLTRKTWFSCTDSFMKLTPARTIYPGNYIVNHEGLKHIIPFGHLRLRMSGPTAGRLVQAEIGPHFASVNLPMLHTRTLQSATGEKRNNDFRPGVVQQAARIDLADEFERQFFGDLMLFSVIQLAEKSELHLPCAEQQVSGAVDQVEAELLELYRDKHHKIKQLSEQLNEFVKHKIHWWNNNQASQAAIAKLGQFMHNIELNFGDASSAYQLILSAEHREKRRQQIVLSLMNYHTERDAWFRLINAWSDQFKPHQQSQNRVHGGG